MILPILLAFGVSLQQVIPLIQNLRKNFLCYRHAGPRVLDITLMINMINFIHSASKQFFKYFTAVDEVKYFY